MSIKVLLIGIIILMIVVLLFIFYRYKKNSRVKKGLVSDSPEQGFLKTIDYSIDLKNNPDNIITLESIPTSPTTDLMKIIDNDYTSPFTFKNNEDGSIYIIKVNFSKSVYLRKIRIYSGYRTGTDWNKVNISSYTGNMQSELQANGVTGEYNNTVLRDDNFSYFDFTEIILDPAAISSPSYRLTFTSSEPPTIREIVFLGYLDRGRDVEKELNSIKLNGFIIKPLIAEIPVVISEMFDNFYDGQVNYSQLLTYKIFDSNINKDMIRLEVPFDKIYSFYKIIIYYNIKENVGFDIIRVSGYNHVIDDSFIEAPFGIKNKRYKQVLMFLPIMDNKLVLDFINPNESLSIINIAFYGFEVQLAYYDQILISNPKQQKINLSEIEVYNEKLENILPSSVNEGKAVVLQTPTNSELVSRIEIIKDVSNIRFVPDVAYTARQNYTIGIGKDDLSHNYIFAPKYFGSSTPIMFSGKPINDFKLSSNTLICSIFKKAVSRIDDTPYLNIYYNGPSSPVTLVHFSTGPSSNLLYYKDFPLTIKSNIPSPPTNLLNLDLQYYIDYRYMLQIQEIPIFKFNNDGTSSLFPKMNQNNEENYRILANGSKNLVAANMIDYGLSPYPEFDSYYKSKIYRPNTEQINIIMKLPSVLKEFTIKFKSNQKFKSIEYFDSGKYITDKYSINGYIYGKLYGRAKDFGKGGDEIISENYTESFKETISSSDVTNGNTKTFNIYNILTSKPFWADYVKNKKFVLKQIEIKIDDVVGITKFNDEDYEWSQIAIDKIMLYDEQNNMITQGNIYISSSTYNTDGTIDNLYDNNDSTYWRSDRDPVKLFVLFNTPIPLDKINIINAPSNSFFYKNMKDVTVKFYNFKNQIINSFEITEAKPTYEFKNLNKIIDSYNITNLYDGNLNSYSSTFPEIEKYRQDISGLRIIGPYILIFFNRPTLLTGVKINNVKSMFLNYKGQEQGDNTIFGLFVQATLGKKWSSKDNTSTPFKCIEGIYDIPFKVDDVYSGQTYSGTNKVGSINAFRINNNISECYSIDSNKCKDFKTMKDCERELQILVPNFNKPCGTPGVNDCLYYQKNIKDNTLCLNVKNNKYIKILNTPIDKNTNSFGCKKNNNLCKEYDSLQSCKTDTITSSDLQLCNNNEIDNPNHWCSKASNLLFDNLYQTPIKVFDISGSGLFPMYCQMDIKDLGCKTSVEEFNSEFKGNEIIYEGPSSNVYVANITSIPYDLSGNIPYTSSSRQITDIINLVYKTDSYTTSYPIIGTSSSTIIKNELFNVPSNIENIESLKFYITYRFSGPGINTDNRKVNIGFRFKEGITIVIDTGIIISTIPVDALLDTNRIITISNPSLLLNYKNKKLSLEMYATQSNLPSNPSNVNIILTDNYFVLKYNKRYEKTEKYSSQIVNNSNYLNCEEVANLIASKKNWSVNKVDYNGRKVVFTKPCS